MYRLWILDLQLPGGRQQGQSEKKDWNLSRAKTYRVQQIRFCHRSHIHVLRSLFWHSKTQYPALFHKLIHFICTHTKKIKKYDFGCITFPRHHNTPRLLLQDKWSITAPSLYKSPQFDMISARHVSCPLADINALPYEDIYGFHYFLQHSIDFEIYSTYMNCPSKLCHYSCLYNRWRQTQWFRITCNQCSSCLRAKEVKVLLSFEIQLPENHKKFETMMNNKCNDHDYIDNFYFSLQNTSGLIMVLQTNWKMWKM